jgi:hypothetical protein
VLLDDLTILKQGDFDEVVRAQVALAQKQRGNSHDLHQIVHYPKARVRELPAYSKICDYKYKNERKTKNTNRKP